MNLFILLMGIFDMSQPPSLRPKRPRLSHQSETDAHDSSSNCTNTVHEKVSHIAQLLQGWSWSFSDLIRNWIAHNNGIQGKRGYQKRVDIIHHLFDDDPDATLKALKDDDIGLQFKNMATTFLVHEIRMEFEELRQSNTFGRWAADEDAKDLNLSNASKQLFEHAPMFKTLMTELACNTTSTENRYERVEEEGYLVMLASILLLKASRNSSNRFARMLGLYLYGTGVKRRALEVLDGLGVTESYHALSRSKKALAVRSEVCQMSLCMFNSNRFS